MPNPLAFCPKVVFGPAGSPTTLSLTYPQKLWSASTKPRGGVAWSDSGVPEAWIINRDQFVETEIRFTETEWATVDAWLNWAQSGNSFDFWFDQNLIATAYTVYLIEPQMGDGEVKPTREQGNRRVFAIRIKIRSTNITQIFDVRV